MTTKQYLNSLRVFQYLFSVGMLSTAGVVGYLLNSMDAIPLIEDESQYTLFNILCIAFGISLSITAMYVFNLLLSRVNENAPLPVKLEHLKKAYILRGAMIEGAGVFALVVFILTMSMAAIYVFTGCLLLIVALFPSRKEIKRNLRLSPEESLKIDQYSSVITNPNDLIFKNRMN
ncbi:MAG: hypothetical protein MI700_08365 [Balneolales bacterium]|nr:hypothetical protein [Balneolales bacterium]